MNTKPIAIAAILTVAMLTGIIATTSITAYADESETGTYTECGGSATASGEAAVLNELGCPIAPIS